MANDANSTEGTKVSFPTPEKEELRDVLLQIWDAGAEGIHYDESEWSELEDSARTSVADKVRSDGVDWKIVTIDLRNLANAIEDEADAIEDAVNTVRQCRPNL